MKYCFNIAILAPFNSKKIRPAILRRMGCKVGKGVFIGSHAVVTDGVQVGDYAQISVGSIVDSDVPAGVTVFGVPARPISGAGENT